MVDTDGLAQLAQHAAIAVPERPRLVAWVVPVEVGDGLLELRAPETHYPLRHPVIATAFRLVANKLDGSRTVEEVIQTDPEAVAPTTVLFLLKTLRAVGVLTGGFEYDGASPQTRELLDYYSQFDPDPASVLARVSSCSVSVAGNGHLADRVDIELRDLGFVDIKVDGEPDDVDLIVGTGTERDLTRINEVAIAQALPLLCVGLDGTQIRLGPLVVPGESACVACMKARASANGARDNPSWEVTAPGTLVRLAAAQAAIEASRFAGAHSPPTTFGRLHLLSARSPQVVTESLLRNPRCDVCGSW